MGEWVVQDTESAYAIYASSYTGEGLTGRGCCRRIDSVSMLM
jgi:hypothetical protein